jgi:hypothetical protein
MIYQVNDKELESVLALPAPKRYQYFIGKITDWQELWSVANADGWVLMRDNEGNELVPVWPAQRFASACCVEDWTTNAPKRIALSDWLSKWTPGMSADGRRTAVFPTPNDQGIVRTAEDLKRDIDLALEAYE